MVDALLSVVFENLNSLLRKEVGSLWGVGDEMERLSSTLSTIRAVLQDAEERQLNNDDRAITNWLQKLSDTSHALDDILSEFEAEALSFSFSSFLGPTKALSRWRIGKKMREVRKRLDEIANERSKYHLLETVRERKRLLNERRQSSSFLTQPKVYGREKDREKIVDFLVLGAMSHDDVAIYPVVGMGGIGKTTLAQLAFNHKRVNDHFELKAWVYVSEDFNVKKVMRSLLEALSGSGCEDLDLDPLQRRVRETFKGKRFLIVLDDVWTDEQEQWDRLKHVFSDCGSIGSSIIVTTRLKKVASIVGTIRMHHDLLGLSEEDCWSLFKQRAFGDGLEEKPSLAKIGREIVRKCGGVPLAAKALGGLMRFKSDESDWVSIAQSELWNLLSRGENSVLSTLRLSYSNLPTEHRRCFSFCALFPKNSRIMKESVIRLWIANGFIISTGQDEVEEIGNRIFEDLLWHSFFEDYKKDYFGDWSFQMHDIVHDLAQSIMEDECCHLKIDDEKPTKLAARVRYLAIPYSSQSSHISTCKSLRTLMLISTDYRPIFLESKFNLPSLRAFDAEHFSLKSMSSLIAISKHLRYLNFSYAKIKILPESICNLKSLQTLNLTGCSHLQKLPEKLYRLRSLRHLNIFGCVQLNKMPCNIGRLTSLRTLSLFVAGGKKGRRLEELESLNLGGDLEIKGLEKVRSPMDAKKSNLSRKKNINKLCLIWGKEENMFREIVDQVLEALEPSRSLTFLEIKNYGGSCFPCWLSNGILENITRITLSNLKNCSKLPSLNKLPNLKHLYIHQLDLVRNVDNGEPLDSFTRLENLMIRNLPNLESLSRDQGREAFPRLSDLYISHCYKLTTLPKIPSVKKLEVWKSHNGLLSSIPNLDGLESLGVSKFNGVTFLPDQFLENLSNLKALRIAYFLDLRELPPKMLIGLDAVEKLHIRHCNELECFAEGFFQGSSRLKCITIEYCKKFRSLSESFRNLTDLQSLDIIGCPELETFPNGLDNLSSLRHLVLSGHCRSGGSQCPAPKMEVLPEALQYLPSLESLMISDFPNIISLPGWIGNIRSLQELLISNCPNLSAIPSSIQNLNKLLKLSIESCPKLQETYESKTGDEWLKIAHISNVSE